MFGQEKGKKKKDIGIIIGGKTLHKKAFGGASHLS